MSKLLQVAFKELGTTEIRGDQHNPRILAYAKESNIPGIQDDETPWCSIFINFCCDQVGFEKSGLANARSWMQIGLATKDPVPGDIVVFWRESLHSWKGHVALYLGHSPDNKKIYCIGGNQGNTVSVGVYDAAKVLGFRKVGTEVQLSLPEVDLKLGDRGADVIALQQVLNHLQYDCGDADGIFGPKTDHAIRLLQANVQITVHGVYNNDSRKKLESLLQS
ncbi:MAG: TIGR02594 family protein [Reichenbachiella sp.]|uniref:C40 family peptidase n=1 Tax=Reichenbachiella sp. TaxID=2184521 RepID=UPI003264098E